MKPGDVKAKKLTNATRAAPHGELVREQHRNNRCKIENGPKEREEYALPPSDAMYRLRHQYDSKHSGRCM